MTEIFDLNQGNYSTFKNDDEKNKIINSSSSNKKGSSCCPRRVLLTILACFGMIVVCSMRVNLAITVVPILDDQVESRSGKNGTKTMDLAFLKWTSSMVGVLHGVFYMGYLVTHIPAGYVCTKVPGTSIFGISILGSCVLNYLLPVTIQRMGFVPTCLVRFFQGLCEGMTNPALYALIRDWAPRSEKSRIAAICLTGAYAGPIIGFPLDGAISHYFGWQYSYYIHGTAGLVWYIFWFLLAYESPEMDPLISSEELEYISKDREPIVSKKHKIPWKFIVTSGPVWAVVVCHFVRSWMFFLMLSNQPLYLNNFHFTILENGIFASLPHMLKVIVTFTSGFMADYILKTGKVSITTTRKVFSGIGFGTEATCCIILVFVSQGYVAIIFLTLGIGISGLAVSGWQINHLDLAPDYASVLVGYSATIGTIGGILSPIIVGIITTPPNLINWQHSFILTGSLLATAAVTFAILGSGERQPWNQGEPVTLDSPIISIPANEDGGLTTGEKATDNTTEASIQ